MCEGKHFPGPAAYISLVVNKDTHLPCIAQVIVTYDMLAYINRSHDEQEIRDVVLIVWSVINPRRPPTAVVLTAYEQV